MKKTTIIFLLLVGAIPCMSQTDTTMKRFADSVCSCMSRLDMGKIKNQNDAQVAMVKCFTEGNMGLLLKVAQERNVDISDEAAMQKIGQEVGVILLMFGVGLHFHLKDLLAVKSIAIPGAVGQSLVATLVAMGIFHFFGWPLKSGMVLGMAMAVEIGRAHV